MSDLSQQPPYAELPELTNDVKNWAMLCHLAAFFGFFALPVAGLVVGPLIVWTLKRDEHPFIDHQGKESINFQISMLIYKAIAALTLCILIGFVFLPLLIVADMVLIIVAAVSASQGEPYRYPLTIRFVT